MQLLPTARSRETKLERDYGKLSAGELTFGLQGSWTGVRAVRMLGWL